MEPITSIRLNEDTELIPFRPEDVDELHRLTARNIRRLHQWLPWARLDHSFEDTKQFLAAQTGHAMSIRHKGRMAGAIELHQNASIGYWLDEAYEGKGIITEACKGVITDAFQRLKLNRIEIRCATENERSAAVPIRLGFIEEAILPHAEWLHDHWVDLRVFSMLRQNWRP